jgi:transcriptional regulator with XRE-family HTH domain
MPTIPQFRAARGLLGWSQTKLAKEAGLSLPTVKRFETAAGARVSVDAVAKMRHAVERAGVEFTNGTRPGVRLIEAPAKVRSRSKKAE